MVAKATLLLWFGIAANCTSLSTALSPTPTFARIVKNRSTEKFSSTPYVVSVFSNAIWLLYGLVTPNSFFVITISSILVIIYGTYCALFWKHAVTFEVRIATERLLFGAALAVAVMAALTWGAVPDNRRTLLLGLFGDVLSVIQVAAPLSVLGTVLQTKSAEYLPLPLCANNLINNTVWGVYALLKGDVFVGAPCVPAFLLGLASVALIFHYGNGASAAKGGSAPTADIMYVGGGSMHGGVSVHRGTSQRGRQDGGKLAMGVPLLSTRLERVDSMPESPTGMDGTGARGVFVISDEEEVHGGRYFDNAPKVRPTENEGINKAAPDGLPKRDGVIPISEIQAGPRAPAAFQTSVSRPASRRSSFAQQES